MRSFLFQVALLRAEDGLAKRGKREGLDSRCILEWLCERASEFDGREHKKPSPFPSMFWRRAGRTRACVENSRS